MEAKPILAVKNRKTSEKLTYRIDQESIVIGRDQKNYIVLDSKRISRHHAEIRFEDGAFFVIDLKSGNGTLLNNQRLTPAEKTLLRKGDHIQIESFDIVFQGNGKKQKDFAEITDTDILEVKMIKKLLRAVDKENAPVLEVASGEFSGKRFTFEGKSQEIVIGRDPACEFQIDSDVISRKHARMIKKWDTVTIIDLASKNGLYVNDAKVGEAVLVDGDRILLGTLPFIYRNPAEQDFDFVASEPPTAQAAPPSQEKKPPQEEASESARIARRISAEEEAAREAEPSDLAKPSLVHRFLPTLPEWARIGPLELVAGLIGLTILVGSIWLIVKLL